jgi:hypothetical protein
MGSARLPKQPSLWRTPEGNKEFAVLLTDYGGKGAVELLVPVNLNIPDFPQGGRPALVRRDELSSE